MALRDEKTRAIQVLQDEPPDHPACRDGVYTVSADECLSILCEQTARLNLSEAALRNLKVKTANWQPTLHDRRAPVDV